MGDWGHESCRAWLANPRLPGVTNKVTGVNSQVFDHTSVGRFLEARFGIVIPGISSWHRAVCGDLTSAFDFSQHYEAIFPALPYVSDSETVIAKDDELSKPTVPTAAGSPFQEDGVRPSRPLPYLLNVDIRIQPDRKLKLTFVNSGLQGAVFHVYDKLHLERIPRRYTVEARREIDDEWLADTVDRSKYDLWVYGPNGFLREIRIDLSESSVLRGVPTVLLKHDAASAAIELILTRRSAANPDASDFMVRANAYRSDGPWSLSLHTAERESRIWTLAATGGWYDFTVTGKYLTYRFAGRLETGRSSTSDPALAIELSEPESLWPEITLFGL